jgi:recombination protein RecT
MNELKKQDSIQDLISSKDMQKQFALALPKHLTAERFARIAITAITKSPKLLACTKESLLSCLLDLSQLGLEPDGRNAHLVPYGNVCKLLIDYKGYVNLARRTGEVADIHADVVCQNDIFTYFFGTGGNLVHRPAMKDRGEVLLKDGSSSYEVMNKEEVEEIRERSKAKDDGPWITDWKEMAKKTVFRRHSKWLPISSELFKKAVEKDYDTPIDITPQSTKPPVSMPKEIEKKEEVPPKQEETLEPSNPETTTAIPPAYKTISIPQKNRLYAISTKAGYTQEEVKSWLMEHYKYDSTLKISRDDYDDICEDFEKHPKVK